MFEDDDLVLEGTENVEEPATEESVEEVAEPNKEVKMYTEEELNSRVDELLAKKIARKEAKIRKEYEDKYSAYREAETVLNAGLGTDNITDATKNLREFYEKRGVNIPQYQASSYNEEDLKVLAGNEAQKIIDYGIEEVTEELDRLVAKGAANMTPREKLVYKSLFEYRQAEGAKQELLSIGVKGDVIDSKDFKDFAAKFNSNVPITDVYAMYAKTTKNANVEKIGSMKNGDHADVKTYYTPEEVDRLTEKDYDNPEVMKRVRESMKKWK